MYFGHMLVPYTEIPVKLLRSKVVTSREYNKSSLGSNSCDGLSPESPTLLPKELSLSRPKP